MSDVEAFEGDRFFQGLHDDDEEGKIKDNLSTDIHPLDEESNPEDYDHFKKLLDILGR